MYGPWCDPRSLCFYLYCVGERSDIFKSFILPWTLDGFRTVMVGVKDDN